jgi:hypothetical protein
MDRNKSNLFLTKVKGEHWHKQKQKIVGKWNRMECEMKEGQNIKGKKGEWMGCKG